MSEIKQIEPANWEEFLRDFADRNNNRRARFDVYRSDGTTEDESEEAHLEDVRVKTEGNSKTVEIIRLDRSHRNTGKTEDVITNVRGVAVQYDTDGSEDALEITDDENTLISLRFESKVDGAS
jgi:hypothetical protein